MVNDREQLQTSANIQIETSEFEWITHYSYSLPFNSKYCFSDKEIAILVETPRLLLQTCTLHFNKFLRNKSGSGTNIIERMFFSEDEINHLWELVKKIFEKPILFKGRTIPDSRIIYRVDANGITPLGDKLLKTLNDKGLIPEIWTQLYLLDRVPPVEKEGVYYFDPFHMTQGLYSQNIIDKLLMDPYFRFMDISTIPLIDCEKNEDIQKILSKSQKAVIFVDKYGGHYIKRLCWKWNDKV